MADNYQNVNNNNSFSNRERVSITTNMFSLWDNNGTQLRLSGMDSGLSLGLWVPFFNQDGSRKYPVEQRYNFILTQKNAMALEDILYNSLLTAYESGKNISRCIFTNSARTNMIEMELRDGSFYLHMHRNCDPTTHIPQSTNTFKFDTVMVIDKYNRVTGEIEASPVQVDFFIFAKAIRAFNNLVGGSISAHGTRVASSYRNNQFMDYIRAIATAVNAQLPASSYQQKGAFHNQQSTGVQYTTNIENPDNIYNLPTPQTVEVNSLTDLIG